jgi:hypothetical protein
MGRIQFKKYLTEFYSRFKTFPTIPHLIEKANLNKKTVQQYIKELIIAGVIVRRGKTYHIKQETKEKAVQKRSFLVLFFKYFNAAFVIRGVMFCISLVAIYISIHYSYLWISEFLEPFKAFLLSVVMVAYVTFSLEAVFLLFKEKTKAAVFMGLIILITAIASLTFSMSMTVIGQYNRKTELLQEKTSAAQANKKEIATLEILKNTEKTAVEAVKIKREEIKTGQTILSGFEKEDTESIEYKTQLWKLSQLNIELRKYETALQKAREELKNFINREEVTTEIIERQDFYSWFATLTGIEKGIVEFLLYLIPALFVDIIAPLGMFIALGLYRKKEKEK